MTINELAEETRPEIILARTITKTYSERPYERLPMSACPECIKENQFKEFLDSFGEKDSFYFLGSDNIYIGKVVDGKPVVRAYNI